MLVNERINYAENRRIGMRAILAAQYQHALDERRMMTTELETPCETYTGGHGEWMSHEDLLSALTPPSDV